MAKISRKSVLLGLLYYAFGESMVGVRLITLLGIFSLPAFACQMLQFTMVSEPTFDYSFTGDCFSGIEGVEHASNVATPLYNFTLQEKRYDYSSYWEDWVLPSKSNPILTQNVSSNYFGLGVWVPSELENQLYSMDTDEWIMSHGVQLSLGFGSKESGEPRMRLDYRWHQRYEGGVMMQVELPF